MSMSLHWVFTLRNRFGVPAIAALLVAMVLVYPLEALTASVPALHAVPLLGPLFRLAIFLCSFTVANMAWHSWLARRPDLLIIEGGRRTRRAQRDLDVPQRHG